MPTAAISLQFYCAARRGNNWIIIAAAVARSSSRYTQLQRTVVAFCTFVTNVECRWTNPNAICRRVRGGNERHHHHYYHHLLLLFRGPICPPTHPQPSSGPREKSDRYSCCCWQCWFVWKESYRESSLEDTTCTTTSHRLWPTNQPASQPSLVKAQDAIDFFLYELEKIAIASCNYIMTKNC